MFPLVLALIVLLQTPAQRPPAKATIEGIVVRAGSGDPVADVQITARLVAASEEASVEDTPAVFTDSRGRFALNDLTPGSWRLTAARNGYTKHEYGQRRATDPGLPLVLAAGQRISDVRFQLTPASILSGRVVDHVGEPIAGLEIQLLKSAYNARGVRTLQPAAQATTDDHGEYRLFWITPGRYYVRVNTPMSPAANHPYKAEVSDQDGHFTMKDISPGEYKVFAWESIEDFEYFDADFVRQFEQRGKTIRISDSEKVSVDLKVIP